MFCLSENNYKLKDILVETTFVKCRKNRQVVEMANISSAFDIETSSFYDNKNQKCACMYIYVIGINGKCHLGRTWDEFKEDINEIKEFYKINSKRRFIIYVHNLAYEFQFIRHLFEWEEVFSLELRRPIYARTVDGIEFRCSYILAQLSLSKVADNLVKYPVKKMVGDLEYEKIRNDKTPLSDKELGYVIHDGLVVMSYIQELIEIEGDINKIPLTNTGFVRALCKKNCIVGKDKAPYRKLIRELTLTPELYLLLKYAYTGGFTHANSWRVNKTYKNVDSYDFTSSYPSVIASEKFPMSQGFKVMPKNKEEFNNFINTFACLIELTLYDVDDKFSYEHYISLSKCLEIEDYLTNNGRVVKAKKLTIVITELDYKIIEKVYDFSKVDIRRMYIFVKDYLPKDFILSVLTLYKDKTELKGIEGKEIEYMRSKSQLNSNYGMCVTDPCKDESSYDNINGWYGDKQDLVKAINSYNNSWSRFLYYPWGIWITAYARYNLWSAILTLGRDYIYSDTDSVKVLNGDKYKWYFERYNSNMICKLKNMCAKYNIDFNMTCPKNKHGESKQLGIWDYEGRFDMFKTLGAKRYITYKDKVLSITVSGVNKKNGSEYLLNKFKTPENAIENFKDELEFPGSYLVGNEEKNANGKMTHTYIDCEREGEIIDYMGNKSTYKELSSVHMEKCNYNMSLSDIFKNYLNGLKESFIQ